ncbi:hypothetical protein KI387_011389, partial [Taxus chinensis]
WNYGRRDGNGKGGSYSSGGKKRGDTWGRHGKNSRRSVHRRKGNFSCGRHRKGRELRDEGRNRGGKIHKGREDRRRSRGR